MSKELDQVIRYYGCKDVFKHWLENAWNTGFGQGGVLVEALPGADSGHAAGKLLKAAESAGWLIRSATAQPTHSQRAFLGLQFSDKIPEFYAEAYGWSPNRDSEGLREYLGHAKALQGKPYTQVQREYIEQLNRQREADARRQAERQGPTAYTLNKLSSPKLGGRGVSQRGSKPKPRTFAVAQAELLSFLRLQDWAVRSDLKIPHATAPSGNTRLYFKTQAVYYVYASFGKFDFGEARSLFVEDIRKLDGPAFLSEVKGFIK